VTRRIPVTVRRRKSIRRHSSAEAAQRQEPRARVPLHRSLWARTTMAYLYRSATIGSTRATLRAGTIAGRQGDPGEQDQRDRENHRVRSAYRMKEAGQDPPKCQLRAAGRYPLRSTLQHGRLQDLERGPQPQVEEPGVTVRISVSVPSSSKVTMPDEGPATCGRQVASRPLS
jgi:hypothetical protein